MNALYSSKILDLAADIPPARRLPHPQASAVKRSRLCGSEVTVDLEVADGQVSDFGMEAKACALGQTSASIVAREIVGSTPDELRAVAAAMRAMLKEGGAAPEGRWSDLGYLEGVKDYPARHASTLLVFDAVLDCLDQAAGADEAALHGGV